MRSASPPARGAPVRTRPLPLAIGSLVLLLAWAGPLPSMAEASFTAHMTLHMTIVAIAAPFLALGLPGAAAWLRRRLPGPWAVLGAAPIAAGVEMLVVWGWHTPALCRAARTLPGVFVAEQLSWLAVGCLVWVSAFAAPARGEPAAGAWGPWAGILALLLTSMHMTLLGTLITLSPNVLYEVKAALGAPFRLTPMQDQQVGGIVMLAVGGVSYLLGGLFLIGRVLADPGPIPERGARTAGIVR